MAWTFLFPYIVPHPINTFQISIVISNPPTQPLELSEFLVNSSITHLQRLNQPLLPIIEI